jgi:Domain of unknown function (DUF4177)
MKWEYKIVYINAKSWTKTGLPEDVNEQFDKFGSEGWELIKVEPKLDGGFMAFSIGWLHQTVAYIAFFKRQLA